MKLVLDKKEYEVKPISIRQYMELDKIPDMSDVDLIHYFTGAPKKDIIDAPFAEVKFIAGVIKSEYGAEDDLSKLNLVYEFNGKRYGLIKPSQLSYGEWINFEVFVSQKPLNLPLLATHLYRPCVDDKIGDDRELIKYDLKECQGRMEEFMDFPVSVVLSALFFLTTFVQKLTEDFLSSTEMKMNNKKQGKKTETPKK